ncbi:putative Tubulin epsilon chain [Paratrimastix pyriformis]|uniref:Tubulin epsilon chain n=1 Tax=Paratrimastix pyriformis TaxID=342808 RepID=A0ABQ8USR3_9EUKA|nr:putative Tubulin epsilon chain [Paratrimastix pyriformis]
MREILVVQVGQCGNQIGSRFWQHALNEFEKYNSVKVYDEAISSFFRNVDASGQSIAPGPNTPRHSLKARAILIDAEEGVLSSIMRSPIRDLFELTQFIGDTSGSGNNWARGFHHYGTKYHDDILDKVRRSAEQCDSLQSFFLLHSLGGGTGSGLGTYTIQLLADEFPTVYRFATSVFPSENDDVTTSPYNSVLALGQLIEHADCVLPLHNEALMEICERTQSQAAKGDAAAVIGGVDGGQKRAKPYDDMNDIAARLLTDLTSSMRFEGSLNVDLNEITMNLVPFPRMHLLTASMAPLVRPRDIAFQPRRITQMFDAVFHRDSQIIQADPTQHFYLGCGLFVRGSHVEISDIHNNIARIRPNLKMVPWNQEAFKVGLCGAPPVGLPYSLLCLANNTCVTQPLEAMIQRWNSLFKHHAHVHHYTEFIGLDEMAEAKERVLSVCRDYAEVERMAGTGGQAVPRSVAEAAPFHRQLPLF